MDKLQPLIKHHFWICFGLAVLLTTIGWSMANGSLSSAIEERDRVVTGAFTDATKGTDSANSTWVEAVKKFNAGDRANFQMAADQLRERQTQARMWPQSIREEMQGIKFLDQITNQITREKWAAGYRSEVEELLQIVKPFDGEQGLVSVDSSRITRRDYNSWRTKVPQSKEIWDAQEDIWLLRSLLTSIAAVNGDSRTILESAIPEIVRLHLRGGDRNAKPAAAAGAGGMGGMGGMSGMGGAGLMGAMGEEGGSGMMGGGMGTANHPGSSFEGGGDGDILSEEFGATSGGAIGGMGGLGGSMGSMGSMGMAGGMGEIGGGSGMGGGGSAAPAEEDRYVDEVEGSYKTRAFVLDVRVKDEKLPELLAKLTDSDFPVEIVRVEISSMGGGISAAGGGMMSGYDDNEGSGMMGGPGMMGGSGMMGGPGMMGGSGMMGAPGMGGSGKLSGGGGGSGMMGAPGLGSDMGGPGMMGSSGAGESGMMGGEYGGTVGQLAAALAADGLLTVRIGGLMTLYQSAEETDAGEKTEAAGDQEESTAAPPTITAPEEPTDGTSGDANTGETNTGATSVPEAGSDPASVAPSSGEVPAGGTASGDAAAAPAEGSSSVPETEDSSTNVGSGAANGATEQPAGK